MKNLDQNLSSLKLSKTENFQISNRSNDAAQELQLVQAFTDNPEARSTFLTDPFKDGSIGELENQASKYGQLRAAILAESASISGREVVDSPRDGRRADLHKQIETSAQMTVRIEKYIENNLDAVNQLSDKELYQVLNEVVFGADDAGAGYSIAQRRAFGLSIANFLQDRNALLDYLHESQSDPKAFAEKYLKQHFQGQVTVERLPIGFAVYLDEADYALIDSDDGSPQAINSKGITLNSNWLPEVLRGRIIAINKGGEINGYKDEESLAKTRRHELRHLIFSKFNAQQAELVRMDTRKALETCRTEKDFAEVSSRLHDDFAEKAKDEIIAYYSNGEFDKDFSALRLHHYGWHIELARQTLEQRPDMTEDAKARILESFNVDRQKCLETVKKIKIVAEAMYERAPGTSDKKQPSTAGNLEGWELGAALLANTAGAKIHRLAEYAGLSEGEIKNGEVFKKREAKMVNDFNGLLKMPDQYDPKWWDAMSQCRTEIKTQLPGNIMPSLIEAVSNWSGKAWGSFWLEEALLIIKDLVDSRGVSGPEAEALKLSLETLILNKSQEEEFAESVKIATRIYDKLK